MARKCRGRQKVEMVKIQNESNRQVTFSKRRSGVFKKASELCTLCGAEVAVIVFSPGRKVYSFGHPSVGIMVERFFRCRSPAYQNAQTVLSADAHRNATLRDLNKQLTMINSQLEAEQKRGEELKQMRKSNGEQNWWELPADQLDMGQLDQLEFALEELQKNVSKQADNLLFQPAASNNSPWMG